MGLSRTRQRAQLIWLMLSSLGALGTVVFLWHISYNKQYNIFLLQQQIDCITQETTSLEQLIKAKKQTIEHMSQLQQKLDTVTRLTRLKEQAPIHLLNELIDMIPENVFLESLRLNGMDIELSGYASEIKDVMQFLNLLEDSKQFKQPNLVRLGSSEEISERDGLTPFTIHAKRIEI